MAYFSFSKGAFFRFQPLVFRVCFLTCWLERIEFILGGSSQENQGHEEDESTKLAFGSPELQYNTWVFPKNSGKTPNMDGENNGVYPIYLMDDLGGKTHYFRKHSYRCYVTRQNLGAQD